MKKIALLMIVFLVTIASAFAAPTASEVMFGDEAQERGETVSATVYVTNYNTLDVKHIDVTSFTGASKYNVEDVSVDVTENSANVTSVSISAYVPLDFDAVDDKGKKVSFDIGDVTLKVTYTDDTTESIQVPLSMEAENNLEFDSDSRIIFDNGDDSRLRDDKSYDDIKRDDDLTLEVVIENKFNNNGDCNDPDDYGDCDIEDVELTLEPDDSDWDDDSVDYNDLTSEETDTESISLNVPDDIDEDDYDFDMWVIGYDENGARHGEFMSFTLEVSVPDDEITIVDAYFSPASIECDVRHVTLKVMIENTGTDDQNKAAIEIDSSSLDVRDSLYNIEIDEGDSETYTFDVSLPEDVQPGTYFMSVETFYNNNDESDIASAQLVVRDCQDNSNDDNVDWEDDNQTDEETEDNTEVNIIEVPPSTGVIVGEEKEPGFFESNAYTLLLGLLFIVALLMFFIMVIVVLRK